MKHTHFIAKTFASTVLTVLSFSAFAGPGALISSPLFVSATAKPNIMLLTDDSGSMKHIVVEDALGTDTNKYDSTNTYATYCGIASPTSVKSREDFSTNPDEVYIRLNNIPPQVSINSRTGTRLDITTVCFESKKTYNAALHADGTTTFRPDESGNTTSIYSGNYLNWYFDTTSSTPNWTSTNNRFKPGTDYRMNITRASLTNIINGLDDNVRIGLATFNDDQGGVIQEPIKTLTGTTTTGHKKVILDSIATFQASGRTPMAEALLHVGRYFLGEEAPAIPPATSTSTATDPGNLPANSTAESNGRTSGTGSYQLRIHPTITPPILHNRDTIFPSKAVGGTLESPIQYWCQNNFVIFMSDGISRRDQAIPDELKDYDRDCVSPATACGVDDRKTVGPYEYDALGSDYLDDVAQALFEIDLRPDINDYATPPNPVLNNIRTYTIAFADQAAINNQLLKDAANQGGGQYFTAESADDLLSKFTEATNSILSTTSSAAAVTFNTSTLGSDTAVYQALFSTSFWSGDIFSFPVDPTTGDILFSCSVDLTANCWNASKHLDNLAYDSTGNTFLDNREVITFDSANQKAIPFTTPVDFTSPATNEITTAMISDLCAGPDAPLVSGVACTSASTSAKDDSQEYVDQVIDYIRGDRTYENILNTPTFRTRQSVLGDIINATPVFVGAPKLPWPTIDDVANKFGEGSGKRYSDYKTAQKDRTKTLYASANDGMIHAFRTESLSSGGIREKAGDELFAFIPSFVFSDQLGEGLHDLAKPSYEHQYYLDLSPTFTDVYIKGKDSSNITTYATTYPAWRTILIGGSRGGQKKGIFALDITDPGVITEATAADTVLWEFTSTHDPDLGYTYSKPTVALTNAVDANGFNRWAAIFGNGYQDDSAAVPSGVGKPTCRAKLFIVFLDGGLDGTWDNGTNNPKIDDYVTIDTQVGTNAAGDCNGLSTPALADTNGDFIVDRVYAGDVKGNMWAFDLTCGGTCAFDIPFSASGKPAPLFTAKDAAGTPQPIMVKPSLARNTAVATSTTNKPNTLVLFGTGQYHTNDDVQPPTPSTKRNTFYGIWDKGTGNLTDNRQNDTSNGSTLFGQKLTTQPSGIGGLIRNIAPLPQDPITQTTIDWGQKYGWYIDLSPALSPSGEERVVVSASIRSDIVFFNTVIPNSQVCGFGGSGWLMSVNFLNGGVPDSTVFDVNHDGVVDANDDIGGDVAVGEQFDGIPADSSFIGDNQYTQSSDKSINKRKIKVAEGLREGRLSWRELRSDN